MKIKILFFLVLLSFAVSLPSKDPVEVIAKEEGKLKSFQDKFAALETALKKLKDIHI